MAEVAQLDVAQERPVEDVIADEIVLEAAEAIFDHWRMVIFEEVREADWALEAVIALQRNLSGDGDEEIIECVLGNLREAIR